MSKDNATLIDTYNTNLVHLRTTSCILISYKYNQIVITITVKLCNKYTTSTKLRETGQLRINIR